MHRSDNTVDNTSMSANYSTGCINLIDPWPGLGHFEEVFFLIFYYLFSLCYNLTTSMKIFDLNRGLHTAAFNLKQVGTIETTRINSPYKNLYLINGVIKRIFHTIKMSLCTTRFGPGGV